MDKIKLAICDDMNFICEYFKMVLKEDERFEVVGTANRRDDVLALAEEKNPDVILLDLNFGKNNEGIEMIPELKEINPKCKVIIITVHDQGDLILDAFAAGADSYLLKEISVDDMKKAIVETCTNMESFSQRLLCNAAGAANTIRKNQQSLMYIMNKLASLSPREYEVLQQLYCDKTYAEIADFLVIEKVTVRSYISSILKKMGYTNSKSMIKDLRELKILENLSKI